jgi:F1F0 ATPase subunit 2
MNDLFSFTPQGIALLLLSVLVGVILSIVYFGGLWFTIQNMDRVKQPALLFTGSFLIRIMVVLAGFYLISDGRFDRLAASFVSFIIARQFVLKWAQAPEKPDVSRTEG